MEIALSPQNLLPIFLTPTSRSLYSLCFFPTMSTSCKPDHRKKTVTETHSQSTTRVLSRTHGCGQFLLPLRPVFSFFANGFKDSYFGVRFRWRVLARIMGNSGFFPVRLGVLRLSRGNNDLHLLPRRVVHCVLFVVLEMEPRASSCKASTLP